MQVHHRKPITAGVVLVLVLLAGCGGDYQESQPYVAHAQGIWNGTQDQAQPGAETRGLSGIVSPQGRWLFVSFAPGANPATDRPTDVSWAIAYGNTRSFNASGMTYDAANTCLFYTAAGNLAPRQSLNANYFKAQFTSGECPNAQYSSSYGGSYGYNNPPPDAQESGGFTAQYDPAYESGASASRLNGTYSNSTLTVTFTTVGEGLAVNGSANADLQMGTTGFCGVAGIPDSRYNAYAGVFDLDSPECPPGPDPDPNSDPNPDFEMLAYLLDTSECSGSSPDTLVLGLNNGSVTHYYHRLCRT